MHFELPDELLEVRESLGRLCQDKAKPRAAEAGSPMTMGHAKTDVPARAIAAIVSVDHPMILSGEVIDAQELVRCLG